MRASSTTPGLLLSVLATVSGCYASAVPREGSVDAGQDTSLAPADAHVDEPTFETCLPVDVLPALGELVIRGDEAVVAYSTSSDDTQHGIAIFRDGRWQSVTDADHTPASGFESLGFRLEASPTGIWEQRKGPCSVASILSTTEIACASWASSVTSISVEPGSPLFAAASTAILSMTGPESAVAVLRFSDAAALAGPVADLDCRGQSCALATRNGAWIADIAGKTIDRFTTFTRPVVAIAMASTNPPEIAFVDSMRTVRIASAAQSTELLTVTDECDPDGAWPTLRFVEGAYWLETSRSVLRLQASGSELKYQTGCEAVGRLLDTYPGDAGTYYRLSTSDDEACRGLIIRRIDGD